ncbi:TIGR02206 family membrane protein [Lederbergia citrea]|uniref:TIGR02206 family membrane protein n=1 Tax=Lederbergia citrea TaxID=2833581 RepID=A0A942ULG6_9BACI|nr:TIGR02206 family membrane protein [Lederbergia citrea]MBS4223611.1 TIGR02206 family membrane protein [Lederbergia citrea]
MAKNEDPSFVMFSTAHIMAGVVLCLSIFLLFILKQKRPHQLKKSLLLERFFALSLLIMEVLYHVWMIKAGRWDLSNSLPLELCSISLVAAILLLWTGNRHLYDFVFFAGIGGALQAVATPDLDLSYPHFRYFHFFYTHFGIILTALYFTWMKGFGPTFKGIIKTMVALNLLLPLVFAVNIFVHGNYMFLRMKPIGGSLLDFLGPYPWYILSLEAVAILMFVSLWLLFRKRAVIEEKLWS